MTQKLWCFHHTDGRRLEGLTLEFARAIVFSLKPEDRSAWLVWCEGWSEWRVLVTVRELKVFTPQPMTSSPPDIPDEGDDSLVNELRAILVAPSEVVSTEDERAEFTTRMHPRIDKNFRVRVECNGKTFTTYSRNISAGGILVEDPLPDWIAGYCLVRLSRPNLPKALKITCAIVENQRPDNRVRLEIASLTTAESVFKFQSWVDAA